jgi:serine/threonine protein kinase/Tfp pilus assembly protein PilF
VGSSFQPDASDQSRPHRIQRLVDDCLSRQIAGEAVSIDDIASSHADLMPELGEALRKAALIGRARRRARGIGADSFTPAGYDIVREIRRGGQGVVFEAVQRSTGRTVAIKWMRDSAFASTGDRMRFEREVRILAQLNHPNIVTIHDSGVTPTGDNYFVMNYIPGMPLDDYVDRLSAGKDATHQPKPLDHTQTHSGNVQPRRPTAIRPSASAGVIDVTHCLKLFEKVCDAVHTAHLRGIIHRDLKPSNIRIDERGEPHILDFGLAKLSDPPTTGGSPPDGLSDMAGRLTGASEFTQSGQFVGSLPWASPEQVEGRSDLIDIRTDVYSLGVILFQMLTGRFPYPVMGHIREVMDHITHTAPTRPRGLRPTLDDEIETIVLKCLAKEPNRRYQSAGELARDLDRYLSGDAIEAKRDSIHYVLRKQLRRYRLPLSIAATIVLLIIAGLGASLYLWQQAVDESKRAKNAERLQSMERARAEQEAAEKSAINGFLQAILGAADPREARDRNITVRTALDEAATKLDSPENRQSPRIEAAIRTTLGQTYRSLGEYPVAEQQLRHAVALYEEADPSCLDAARAWNQLGLVRIDLNRSAEAVNDLHKAVAIAETLPAKQSAELAIFLNSLAIAYFELNDHERAEAIYRRALETQRRRLGNMHEDVAETLDNLGMLLTQGEKYDEAEPLLREALLIQREVLDAQHPHLATTLSNLADVLVGRGDSAEAEKLLREVLQIRVAVLGDSHPHVAIALVRLARVLSDRNEVVEAESLLRQALAIRRKSPDEGWPMLAANICDLAQLLSRTSRSEEAESLYREALDIRRKRLGQRHVDTAEAMNNLAGVLCDKDRADEALELYRESMRILEVSLPADDQRLPAARNNLANVLRMLGKHDEAEPLHREVLRTLQARYPDGHRNVARSTCNLAITLAAQGKYDESVSLYRSAIEQLRRLHAPADHFDTADALGDLAAVQSSAGRHADAEASLREALTIIQKVMPAGHPARIAAASRLAECLARQKKFDQADALWTLACDQMKENPAVTAGQRQTLIERIIQCYEDASRQEDAARWRNRLSTGE